GPNKSSYRKMIGLLLLFMFAFDNSVCLTERGRIALTRAYRGIDLEKRHERLRNFGMRGRGRNITAAMERRQHLTNSTAPNVVSGQDGSILEEASIEEMNQVEGVDEYLFDADMILTDEQLSAFENSLENRTRVKRQIADGAVRWADNKVYYYFDATITAAHQAYVRTVLKYLQARTCLTFIEDATATNRIRVFNGGGCYSGVGMRGGEQDLSLAGYCIVVGTVAHEFTHALGALHMHMRHDRDTYITVDTTYVKDGYEGNFGKSAFTINNTPYEYGSDMHYASNTFTTSGNSMVPVQKRYLRTLGSKTISFYDIRMINWFYKCNAPCNGLTTTAKCKNGGAPNPRNCQACICPFGYGGTLCDRRRVGCGGTLAATTTWKTRTITVGVATVTTIRDTYSMCNDWITAPAGKTIQIRVTALKDVRCKNGCVLAAIEPKVIADRAMTSPRICCSEQLNQILSSKINPTPVVTFNLQLTSTFTYQYRYI
uniref:Zinc metalloproteinase n=1 Tax=Haemonchus contortus TaxID=6289 RepID=A0A7I4YK13_HAECO